jgi:SM-20-related protein
MLPVLAEPSLAAACDELTAGRYAVVPEFLPGAAVAALAAEARRRDATGDFRPARVGRGERREERGDIRGDRTLWLDEWAPARAEVALWAALERLRVAVNRATLLGLYSFEGHYAIYPPGAFYRRHRDRFRDDDARTLSCVLYLNDGWAPDDGGELRVHLEDGSSRDLAPGGGTLVCFLSDRCEHEVLPARRERYSVAGWFLRRT